MKLIGKFLPKLLCLLTIFTLLCAASVFAATEEIRGAVHADQWDDDYNVTAVVILTGEGEQYAVSPLGKGLDLLSLDGVLVRVVGEVTKDEFGRKIIEVSNYWFEELGPKLVL